MFCRLRSHHKHLDLFIAQCQVQHTLDSLLAGSRQAKALFDIVSRLCLYVVVIMYTHPRTLLQAQTCQIGFAWGLAT